MKDSFNSQNWRQYDAIGAEYLKLQLNQDFEAGRQLLYDQVREEVLCGRVLDLGCGNGRDLELYRSWGAAFLAGVDANETMITRTRNNLCRDTRFASTEIDLVCSPLEQVAFAAHAKRRDGGWRGRFDVVTAHFSLHHVYAPVLVMSAVSRLLRSGGRFVFAVPHPEYVESLALVQGVRLGELVTASLFGEKLSVQYHHHSMDDYRAGATFFRDVEYFAYDMFGGKENTGLVVSMRAL